MRAPKKALHSLHTEDNPSFIVPENTFLHPKLAPGCKRQEGTFVKSDEVITLLAHVDLLMLCFNKSTMPDLRAL